MNTQIHTHKCILYVNHLVKKGPQGFLKSSKWLFDQKVKKVFRRWYVIAHLCLRDRAKKGIKLVVCLKRGIMHEAKHSSTE